MSNPSLNFKPVITHSNEIIIAQTKKWITDVVAGCNFCPFASREIKRNSIHYQVLHDAGNKQALEAVMHQFIFLDDHPETATSLLIMPQGFEKFNDYLDLLELTEKLLKKEKYEGIYQVASFHPAYLFAGSNEQDPSNYTNRSPYPMLHFLREEAITEAVEKHPDIESVPTDNIAFASKKGLKYMQQLLASCLNDIQ